MKIAVTGATGFIGRHVIAELSRYPVDIIGISRQSLSNVPRLPKIKTHRFDLTDSGIDLFDRLGRPNALIHLAWDGLPHYKSLHHFEEQLPMQYDFLKNLIASGLGHLFVAGTCFEYGMQSGPLSENMPSCPKNPYGFAKDALHKQLMYLKTKTPFSLVWGRLFYLYGDGQASNSLFPQLYRAIEQKEKIFNMSGGEQLRDYLPVTEAAGYIVSLALGFKDMGRVNICSGQPVSVRKLVEGWIKANHWQIQLNLGHYPYPDHEPMAFWGDRKKLNHCLGQCPPGPTDMPDQPA